jgi:hypothetical protein
MAFLIVLGLLILLVVVIVIAGLVLALLAGILASAYWWCRPSFLGLSLQDQGRIIRGCVERPCKAVAAGYSSLPVWTKPILAGLLVGAGVCGVAGMIVAILSLQR